MCAKFRWNRESVNKVRTNIRAYGEKGKRNLAVALGIWAGDCVASIQDEIARVKAFDQGLLAASTQHGQPKFLGPKIRVIVFNPLEYASVIEFGRRPGSGGPPPLLPLVGWAGRKGIVKALPRNIGFGGQWAKDWAASLVIFRNLQKRKGGRRKKNAEPMDPVVRDMLIIRLIARSIFEKGTQGRHPFSTGFDRKSRTFTRDIASAVSLLR